MKEHDEIKEQLGNFASKYGPAAVMTAKVTAVNGDDTVAVIFGDDSTVDDARLKSVVKAGDHFVLVPKIGSVVQVSRLGNSDEYVVIAVDEITEIKSKIETASLSFNDAGFVIKKGGNTLWDAQKLLIEAVEKILVLQGNNPDFIKLAQSKTMFKDILNGT